MELVLALGIGVLVASGVWLILRPRTFQVIIGLSLIAYAVNLFIFAMGRLRVGAPPTLTSTRTIEAAQYTDPRAPGAGADRDRDQFRPDSTVPGGPAGRPGTHGDGPCRWAGAA
jgi:hypothetical protein